MVSLSQKIFYPGSFDLKGNRLSYWLRWIELSVPELSVHISSEFDSGHVFSNLITPLLSSFEVRVHDHFLYLIQSYIQLHSQGLPLMIEGRRKHNEILHADELLQF